MTIILSKILGLYFLGVGVAFLSNLKQFKALYKEIAQSKCFCFLGGVLSLFIGAFFIAVHNFWSWDYSLVITLVGWLSFFKGFWLLSCFKCDALFNYMSTRSNVFYKIMGTVVILIGVFFVFMGWF
jgi:hypothetical protein